MLTVGLTGGIGSGKTMVANLFVKLGATVIDTDLIAREVVEPKTPGWQKIVAHFGKDFLNSDQTIDRAALAKKIFHDSAEKIWLEQLLHPLIREKISAIKATLQASYCIVVIPLLVETLPNPDIDRILVVTSPKALQISRTQTRDQRSLDEINAIINAQATPEQRLAVADDIITNDGSLAKLSEAVAKLHSRYLELST